MKTSIPCHTCNATGTYLTPGADGKFYSCGVCGGTGRYERSLSDKLRVMVEALLVHSKDSLEMQGGCDHSVNICVCGLRNDIEDAENLLAEIEGKPLPHVYPEYPDKHYQDIASLNPEDDIA